MDDWTDDPYMNHYDHEDPYFDHYDNVDDTSIVCLNCRNALEECTCFSLDDFQIGIDRSIDMGYTLTCGKACATV